MPVRIYHKDKGVLPADSHKPNSAVPQAYYYYKRVERGRRAPRAGVWRGGGAGAEGTAGPVH